MTISTQKNEIAKREYFFHCRKAQGYAESTIRKYGQCIYKWQKCFPEDDFSNFDRYKCDEFLKFLKEEAERKSSGLSNQYDILRHLKKFFEWLSNTEGYEKINKNDLDFLSLSKEEVSIALEKSEKEIPTLEEIKLIVTAIKGENEVARRDRALIAFLILTGMRISAVISLPMQAFNPQKLTITQSRKMNVKTKNNKKILSTFLPIGWEQGERYFLEWYNYLTKEKGFKETKPIFPTTQSFSKQKVSDEFWKSSSPARKIIYERCSEANVQNFNPHSFRHAVVANMSEKGLTEADKRAISLVLGHEHVGTTFGSYGYGSLTPQQAVELVKSMRNRKGDDLSLPHSDAELGKLIRDALVK